MELQSKKEEVYGPGEGDVLGGREDGKSLGRKLMDFALLTIGNIAIRNISQFVVAETMSKEYVYDAEATAATMLSETIRDSVSGLDRAELLTLMNLEDSWPLVADIKGVHPPSLTVPKTLKIHADEYKFLEEDTSTE